MDSFNLIMNAISSVGFPIVCALGVMYLFYKEILTHKEEIASVNSSNAEQINALIQSHKEDNMKFTTALENNTAVIERLCEVLEITGVKRSDSDE